MNQLLFDQDDLEIEPELEEPEQEPEPELEPDLEPDAAPENEPATIARAEPDAPHTTSLAEIMPPGFQLPILTKFLPDTALRVAADTAAAYALSIAVEGDDGVRRADLALAAVRNSVKAIKSHLADPIAIANALHTRLTTLRAEWTAPASAAAETVGRRILTEHARLDQIARQERLKAQMEADERARADAQREAEAAARAQAPAPVVEELKRQAQTAVAPPVHGPVAAPVLQGSTPAKTWKCRLIGTPGSSEPNPSMADLTPDQRAQVLTLMKAVIAGQAPLVFFELSWTAMNKRAVAERQTLSIPGIETFEAGTLRAKKGSPTN